MNCPRFLVAVLVVVAGLTGCAKGETEVEHPQDAVRLVANQPQRVGEVRAVVGNIEDGSAFLSVSVSGETGPADGVDVEVGDTVDLKGHSFEIVDIVPDPGASKSDQDGASVAAVWVLVD